MARTVRDAKLETREARLKLKPQRRHYRGIGDGLALCYRRTTQHYGTWGVRIRGDGGRYGLRAIGMADDYEKADGVRVLSYHQANDAARTLAKHGIPSLTPLTVRLAADRYLDWYRDHRKAYTETKAAVDAHIVPRLGDKAITHLTTREIRDWLNKLAARPPRRRTRKGKAQEYGAKPATDDDKRARRATANRVLSVLRALLNRAFEDELVRDDSAWRKVKPFKGADEPVIRFLTTAESTRLLNASPAPLRVLVAGALHTGARYSELASVTVGDFDPRGRSIYLKPAKSGKGRHVPVTTDGLALFKRLSAGKTASELLFTRADGSRWGKNHQVRPLTAACTPAKIVPAITFHELRHSYASALAQRGVDLLTISKLLGHADTRITSRHYAHLTDSTLKAAVAKLPSFGPATDRKVSSIR